LFATGFPNEQKLHNNETFFKTKVIGEISSLANKKILVAEVY
jgi:hypothetical protein